MQYKKGFILSVLCLLATDVFSQQLNFRHLTIDDGLSQNAVYSILKDSRGFMWFGISIQFVRVQCVSVVSVNTYNPDEEMGAEKRTWNEYYQ